MTDSPRSSALRAGLSIQPAESGVRVEAAFQNQRFTIAPEYTDLNGFVLNAGFSSVLSRRVALGILAAGGSKKTKHEWLANAGWQLTQANRVTFTAGRLYQTLNIPFISGTEAVSIRQDAGGISYQLAIGRGVLQLLGLDAYFARTPSRRLESRTVIHDDEVRYELAVDQRRIAGADIYGLQIRVEVAPWRLGTIRVDVGGEQMSYDYLAGLEIRTFLTQGLRINQGLGRFDFGAVASSTASQRNYSVSTGHRSLSGRRQTSLLLTALRGRRGLPDDNQARLTYAFGFGGPHTAVTAGQVRQSSGRERAGPASDLLSQVLIRPSFIPSQVVARLDPSVGLRRLIVVEKSDLPAGTVVDYATGDHRRVGRVRHSGQTIRSSGIATTAMMISSGSPMRQ